MRKDAGKFRRHVKKGLKAVTASLQSTAPSSDKSALLGLIRDSRSTYSLAREIEVNPIAFDRDGKPAVLRLSSLGDIETGEYLDPSEYLGVHVFR